MSTRLKLSKKFFMTLKPGQYIMNNFVPLRYEEISDDQAAQWERWRSENGTTIAVFDSEDECLKEWWSLNSGFKLKKQARELYIHDGKMNKKSFMAFPDGHYLMFTSESMEPIKLSHDRGHQWLKYKHLNGLRFQLYKNFNDYLVGRERIFQGSML